MELLTLHTLLFLGSSLLTHECMTGRLPPGLPTALPGALSEHTPGVCLCLPALTPSVVSGRVGLSECLLRRRGSKQVPGWVLVRSGTESPAHVKEPT